MIKVYVKKLSNYAVSASHIKKTLRDFLQAHGIVSDTEVTVTFVGKKKMIELAHKYLKENNVVHNVLSFPYLEEKGFVEPPRNVIHLGEIVVCYPKVVEEAKEEGCLIEEKVLELVTHGALHLLGEHHE